MSYGDEPLATMTNFVEHATPFTSVRSGQGAANPTRILRQPVNDNPTPKVVEFGCTVSPISRSVFYRIPGVTECFLGNRIGCPIVPTVASYSRSDRDHY